MPTTSLLRCPLAPVIGFALAFQVLAGWAADERTWELSPYRVQIHLAVDSSARPGMLSEADLSERLLQRIRSTISPLWNTEIVLPQGSQRTRQFDQLDRIESDPEFPLPRAFDKHIFLSVEVQSAGYHLAGREFDTYTGRWTPVVEAEVRQDLMVLPQCLDLLRRVFAPLAMVQAAADDEAEVTLIFRGSQLAAQSSEALMVHEQDLFQPLMVRLSRAKNAAPDLVAEVPWTLLVADTPQPPGWVCRVYSGTRRPFGTRRRGRVELIALGIKTPLPATQVRFHASHDPSQGLRGYEVLEQLPATSDFETVGLTDLQGAIQIAKSDAPVRMLVLRSDTQLLAKVPVAPGSRQQLEIPISDDMARLLVQEALEAQKEKLIDVVARRNILMTRVRALLAEGEQARAEALLLELNNLPGRADFAQDLKSLEELTQAGGSNKYRSENPRIQATIQRLLQNTQALLGRFLGIREITKLESEVRNSPQPGSP